MLEYPYERFSSGPFAVNAFGIELDRSSSLDLAMQVAGALRQAMRSGSLGSNQRLPSTRDLAKELGVRLYASGLADAQGESATPKERLASLLLGHRLIGSADALRLFDDVEDLFRWDMRALLAPSPRSSAFMSKQWFNNLLETNPVPVKAALAMLGQIEEEYRLPLVPMSPKNREVLRATMKAVGILR